MTAKTMAHHRISPSVVRIHDQVELRCPVIRPDGEVDVLGYQITPAVAARLVADLLAGLAPTLRDIAKPDQSSRVAASERR